MAKTIQHTVTIDVFDNFGELSQEDQELITKAKEASNEAYAPYSQFQVGAAVRLKSGKIIQGSNQENVAYPSGLCAERVAVYYANATYPKEEIESIAITAKTKNFEVDKPITPCGSCRQAIAEYEIKQQKPIRIIMMGESGSIHICNGLKMLLPFMFNEQELKKE